MSDMIDDILHEGYLDGIENLDIDEVRAKRRSCKDIETGLSYLRRLVQGRLDVVTAEQERREAGDDGDGLDDLIARLPALLAGSTRTPGTGRLPESLGTGTLDPGLEAELDDIITQGHLSDPSDLSDEELTTARTELGTFETKVSGLRRALFDRIDALEAELTRRYRTGEASVDSLLG